MGPIIQRTYDIGHVDPPFLDSLHSLTDRGLNIQLNVEEDTLSVDYFFPSIKVATLSAELYTREERDAFDFWVSKENFRLALKGMPLLRLTSESQTI